MTLIGHTCPHCRSWVPIGTGHACTSPSRTYPPTYPPPPANYSPTAPTDVLLARIAAALERIATALGKAQA
jgi:hypothetical protein